MQIFPATVQSRTNWPIQLQLLTKDTWAAADSTGSLGLVLESPTALPRSRISRLLRFARVVAVMRPHFLEIWRRDAVTQFPIAQFEADSESAIRIFNAPSADCLSIATCEKAIISLSEFAAACGQAHRFTFSDLMDSWLGKSSQEPEVDDPLRSNARHWLNCWQDASAYKHRPAAFASEVYARLAPKLDRLGQRKRSAWFTPAAVADFLALSLFELLGRLSSKPCIALEPAAGYGNLAEALLNAASARQIQVRLTAIESHAPSAELCRIVLSPLKYAQVIQEDWLTNREQVDTWLQQHRTFLQSGYLLVVSNPPWSGISSHMNSWLQELIADYKIIDGFSFDERKHWLSDEYVKFLRLIQYLFDISQADGAVAFVCSHSWLDNPTFRGLRRRVLDQFSQLYLIDLHGSKLKREAVPSGMIDENLFGIRQGICLVLALKSKSLSNQVMWSECWGTVQQKLEKLRSCAFSEWSWTSLQPNAPDWVLVPRPLGSVQRKPLSTSISELFQVYGSGIVTARDRFALADRPDELIERIQTMRSRDLTDEELAQRWGLRPTSSFNLAVSRELLRQIPDPELGSWVRPILYRPFWWRYIFYHDAVIERRVYRLMQHLEHPNLALVTVRRSAVGDPAGYYLAAQGLVSQGCIRADNQSIDYVFPLWRYEWPDGLYSQAQEPIRVSNLKAEALLLPEQLYARRLTSSEVFGYIYALAWSTGYRMAYQNELRSNFMRLVWVSEVDLFLHLSGLGLELAHIHAKPLDLPHLAAGYYLHEPKTGCLDINRIEPRIVGLQIGSYTVVSYWLKKHRQALGHDPDYIHRALEQMVYRLQSTLDIQSQIDDLIPESYWTS